VELGYRGFALTVDAVRLSKRERDLRLNSEEKELGYYPKSTTFIAYDSP
jgi:hypothetical protein